MGQDAIYDRESPIRWLEAPLLMADVMSIFGVGSPTALKKMFWLAQGGKEEDFEDVSKSYHRYRRGAVMPGDKELNLWRIPCAVADRVKKLALWSVLSPLGIISHDEEASVLNTVNPEVRRLVLGGTNSVGVNDFVFLRERTTVIPLVRLCHVDALTVLLMFIEQAGGPRRHFFKYTGRLIPYAVELLIRLYAFPPFSDELVQKRLFQRIVRDFLTFQERGEMIIAPPQEKHIQQEAKELIIFLRRMGNAGLIKPTLRDQIRFVNWYRERVIPQPNVRAQLRAYSDTDAPITIKPTDETYQLLRVIKYAGTRAGKPIHLPRNREPFKNFTICNSLGESKVDLTRLNRARARTTPARRIAEPELVDEDRQHGGRNGAAPAFDDSD